MGDIDVFVVDFGCRASLDDIVILPGRFEVDSQDDVHKYAQSPIDSMLRDIAVLLLKTKLLVLLSRSRKIVVILFLIPANTCSHLRNML